MCKASKGYSLREFYACNIGVLSHADHIGMDGCFPRACFLGAQCMTLGLTLCSEAQHIPDICFRDSDQPCFCLCVNVINLNDLKYV